MDKLNYNILNKVVLFTVLEYIEKQKSQHDEIYQREELTKIASSIKGYQMFHRFSQSEANVVIALGKEPSMQKLKETEVDYAIYAIELLYLWAKQVPNSNRPHLNYSDTRIRKLKTTLIMDMLKTRETESHPRIKEIVEQSRLVAKHFFGFFESRIA